MKPGIIFFFTQMILSLLISSVAAADAARFLRTNRDALQARFDLIFQAQKSVTMEYFGVASDRVSYGLLTLLRAKAQQGVKVQILVDGLGHTMDPGLISILKDEANIKIKFFNPSLSFNRLHGKSLCADSRVCILGGRNISNKYFKNVDGIRYTDLDVIVNGPVASVIQDQYFPKIFAHELSVESDVPSANDPCYEASDTPTCEDVRNSAVAAMISMNKKYQQIMAGKILVKPDPKRDWLTGQETDGSIVFLADDPTQPKSVAGISAAIGQYIKENTRQSIAIVSPYVILNDWATGLLSHLKDLQVQMMILTNGFRAADHKTAYLMYQSSKIKILDMNIDLFEYKGPDTVHAKAVVLDEKIVLIGSYNFDTFSSEKNREVSLIIPSRRMARELKENIVGEFLANSTQQKRSDD